MYHGIETIYLIHHSHTDIGYTHDQPIVWDLHRRFIDTALDQCERQADNDADHAFRWTVETTAMLLHWLESAPAERVNRFVELVHAGRIEVTGMYLNMSPLADTDQIIEALAPVHRLRDELGIPIRHAMNSDVNGQNWPLVDVLIDAGITGFSMATNIHFGGSPLEWPNAFHWEGPSGRSILAWNGWDYAFAREAGIGEQIETFRDDWWPRIDAWLSQREYALPVLMLQIYDAFGDNGPACTTLSAFVEQWNEQGGSPRLRIALPSEWWSAVAPHAARLPTHRGDWTDFWNFGSGSSAREVKLNRANRQRLRGADAAEAGLAAFGGVSDPTRRSALGTRSRAWDALHLFDEHTWGADTSIRHPHADDVASQWHHKANHAYTARSLSSMLARDAVAELARRVDRPSPNALFVFNPLPFARTVATPIPETVSGSIRGRPDDPTAARHSMDRSSVIRAIAEGRCPADDSQREMIPVSMPAFGYTVVPDSARPSFVPIQSDDAIIDTPSHRIVFDRGAGGIRSWYSKKLDRNLVDQAADWPLGGWVQERPIQADPEPDNPRRAMWRPVERRLGLERGWRSGWPASRRGPERLIEHRVEQRNDGVEVFQRFELPDGSELRQRTSLPEFADWIECSSEWEMDLGTEPKATYIAFPFAIPGAIAHLDLGGQAMRMDVDQLPRACRDFFTVQGWVDFSNSDFGVTVACPDAPLVQVGDFTFGAGRETVELPRAMLLGWVTNNYWETNFRAHQPGTVRARYRLVPHGGGFDETAAHRTGLDAASPPLVHHLREAPAAGAAMPPSGSLLMLPEPPVLTLHIWPDGDVVVLRLLNASDQETIAVVRSSVLRIMSASRCDIFGTRLADIAVDDGAFSVPIEARALGTFRLNVDPLPNVAHDRASVMMDE